MNVLFIKGKRIEYNDESYELDDMFSDQLFEVCNELVDKYDTELNIVNEVFINRVQPYNAVELFLSKLNIEIIKLEKTDELLLPIILDYAENNNIVVKGIPFFYKTKSKIYGQLSIILSLIYLIFKMISIPYSSEIKSNKDEISLIRTPASRKKLAFLTDIDFKFEDFNDKKSIYNCFSKCNRIHWVAKSWMVSYKELNKYSNYIQSLIGSYSSADVYKYYGKRIVHTILYSIILDKFFNNNIGKKFYTGNNLDRFALIEEKTAKKYNIHTVCIPHGLEYGFKLPHCFIGDEFYTTSLNASIHLNKLYNTTKFLYSQYIASNMFSVYCKNEKKVKDIVFFTEPREIEVNFQIIEELIPLLNSKKLQLFIKLHPKDNKVYYEKYSENIVFIDDFNSSVTENICISRKSTTLLEAVYNNSDAAAILINKKDNVIFKTFPSLQDKSIEAFSSVDNLYEWILEKTKVNLEVSTHENYRCDTSTL